MADRSDAPKARALGQRSIFLPLAPSRPQVEAYAPKSFAKTAFHTGSIAQFAKNFSIVVARPHRVNYLQCHAISGALIYVPCVEFYRKLLNLIDFWGFHCPDLGQHKSK
jgi:hypothetical protein